jgi:pyruvate dehydrogenase E2 component (dihydrolipoamide acetyltransferase)
VASPIVRHLAHERGVDLASLHGSGPDGLITRADVDAASAGRPAAPAGVPAAPAPVGAPAGAAARPRLSPLARRRAVELGLDPSEVHGTGPAGAVTAADVARAAAARAAEDEQPAPVEPPAEEAGGRRRGRARKGRPSAQPSAATTPEAMPAAIPAGQVEPSPAATAAARAAAMRQTIANLMARSKREIPHYYLQETVDFAAADTFVRGYNAQVDVSQRVLPAVLLLKAAALAVHAVPEMNGFVVDGQFHRSDHVHLGVAVSLRGGGLVAPAIHDADTLPLPELMVRLKDLVARTRAGRLRGSEMSDPTITVTNLGEQGTELVHGVIYPPQVALVGFGRIVMRPWAVDGMLAVRPVVTVTLAADHRVSDGHRGGRYLTAVADLLQRPEEL